MKSPLNFLGLPKEDTLYEKSSVVVVPCPLEKTTTYRHGTKEGPQAILEASCQVEFYDVELKSEMWLPGIHTWPSLDFEGIDSKKAVEKIQGVVGKILGDKKFPLCLGGEHALSEGPVAALNQLYPNLSILQIDAHADLRESYEGTPYNHACAMRRALKVAKKLSGVGIRSLCLEESEWVKKHAEVLLLLDHERRTQKDWIQKALDHLTDTVYLTIDIDGFDPALVPATGTPEPGGLSWYEGLDLIRSCFEKKRVVGADLVELLPTPDSQPSAFVAAKLTYKVIGYWKHFQSKFKKVP